ncbi:hypothetical protein SUGI_1017210 [Cryptomeria japonica]|nr:hypothetical protein SUGI_1017210 [Cryptomeria japonica]
MIPVVDHKGITWLADFRVGYVDIVLTSPLIVIDPFLVWEFMRRYVEDYSFGLSRYFFELPKIMFITWTVVMDLTGLPQQVMFHVVIRVAQCQHGGSFLRLICNPRITWVCSSAVEDEEANVGLLGFTLMVF